MNGEFLLIGPLAQPEMMAALGLEGRADRVDGNLWGGEKAGIVANDWPSYRPGPGALPAMRVTANAALRRYAAVMGLAPRQAQSARLLGVGDGQARDAEWRPDPDRSWLAAEIATLLLQAPEGQDAAQMRARLPMIGVWAESRIRARSGPVSGGKIVSRRGPDDIRLSNRHQPYAGFFAVETWTLSHRAHDRGFTPAMTREGFVMGDAVVVLPWDPVRDRVLVIEQFRIAPALRQDPQPWLLEPIAGRIDAGESVQQAARREAREEADLCLRQLFPAVHHYPSPGAVTEFLYLYVGVADLADGTEGVHGLATEAEDIRSHLMPREALLRMVLSGQVTNGPLAMLSLWLQGEKDRLRRDMSGS